MRHYFHLRLRLLGRLLRELGWWRLLLLGTMLLAAGSHALLVAAHHPVGQWAVSVVGAGVCLSAHRRRADLTFLPTVRPWFRQWLAVEYALLVSPAALVLLACGRVGAAALLLVLVGVVPWAPVPATREHRQGRHSLFRAEAFEWISGWRQGRGALVWLGLMGVALWQHQHATVVAGAAVLWLLWVLSCYGIAEPPVMLLTAATGVVTFLRRRLLLLWTYYLLTAVPLLAMGMEVGTVGLLLWSLAVLGGALLAKYAFYPTTFLIRTTQAGIVALGLLFVLNTVYGALFVAIWLVVLIKSQRQLAAFRYD